MTDIPLNCDGHLACLSCVFSVFILDIMSDVLRKNVGHVVQNVGHVRMSDDFSYTLHIYTSFYFPYNQKNTMKDHIILRLAPSSQIQI